MPAPCEEEYNKWKDAYKEVREIKGDIADNEAAFETAWDDAYDENMEALKDGLAETLISFIAGHPVASTVVMLNEGRKAVHATNEAMEKSDELSDQWLELSEERMNAESKANTAAEDFCDCFNREYGEDEEQEEEEEEESPRPKWPKRLGPLRDIDE